MPTPNQPQSETDIFLREYRKALTNEPANEHEAVRAGLQAVTGFRKSQPAQTATLANTTALLREREHPLSEAVRAISSCAARIENDMGQRQPCGPAVHRTWQLQTAIDLARLFGAPAPTLPMPKT